MFEKIGYCIDALINNFVQINLIGFQNILSNPMGLLFTAAAVITIVTFIKTKAVTFMYLAIFIIACGYGSILLNGINIFIETLGKLVAG